MLTVDMVQFRCARPARAKLLKGRGNYKIPGFDRYRKFPGFVRYRTKLSGVKPRFDFGQLSFCSIEKLVKRNREIGEGREIEK